MWAARALLLWNNLFQSLNQSLLSSRGIQFIWTSAGCWSWWESMPFACADLHNVYPQIKGDMGPTSATVVTHTTVRRPTAAGLRTLCALHCGTEISRCSWAMLRWSLLCRMLICCAYSSIFCLVLDLCFNENSSSCKYFCSAFVYVDSLRGFCFRF